jgi:serine/threonine-protein kinase
MQQEIWFQKYRIIKLLGRGGTAEVYLAEHIKLNSYRAIKCISKKHPLYELQRNEALLLKNLKHSCIPIIYDIEEDEESSYIVEQYLEGDTLKELVASEGPIREERLLDYTLLLCDVIDYLHKADRPILYIDLKPENILVLEGSLKLVDFGSAIYQDELSAKNKVCGTKGYAAPELYLRRGIDNRCEVYGIGMLMYFMATGRSIPVNTADLGNIDQMGDCSKQLKNIINHCLKFHPAQRYATVAQLKKQLSVLRQKCRGTAESGRLLTIAVAGTQQRVGVTHLSIRLCKYLLQAGKDCLYQERNNSGHVSRIRSCYEEALGRDGVYKVKGIPMTTEEKPEEITVRYQVTVQDYGCLSKDNLYDFLKADQKLLILGAKDWELQHSEQILDMTAEYKDITYLFNFLDGRQFCRVCRSMGQKNCRRLPYEPDPYARHKGNSESDFFRELLGIKDKHGIRRRMKRSKTEVP